ncbi:MAG: hypothetical protein KAW17_01720 [Candidatus Eisenbacteria sp.]|nr:hypothetical protein [Candidatus Eisenbacteria bacterium]
MSSIIGALVGLLLTQVYHARFPSPELVALQGEVAKQQQARQELVDQIGEVKEQLEPFLDLARDMYPALDVGLALARIRSDITEVRELASRDIPTTPSPEITKKTVLALKEWQSSHPDWKVHIYLLNAGTKNAPVVESVLTQLLNHVGIPVRTPIRHYETIIVGRRICPLAIKGAPGLRTTAEEFRDALATYLLGEIHIEEDPEVSHSVAVIALNGEPNFRLDGTVLLY